MRQTKREFAFDIEITDPRSTFGNPLAEGHRIYWWIDAKQSDGTIAQIDFAVYLNDEGARKIIKELQARLDNQDED